MTIHLSSRLISTIATTALVSSCAASLATIIFIRKRIKREQRKITNENEDETNKLDKDGSTDPNQTLGPVLNPESRFELNLRGKIDRIYENHGPKPFEFNSEVVKVFDDMVSRSVPLYCEVIDLAIYWFQRHYQPGTAVYDLGCSTGTTIDVLARSYQISHDLNAAQQQQQQQQNGKLMNEATKSCHFIGVDNSKAMVEECNKKLDWAKKNHTIEIHCLDVLGFPIKNASFVVMNYTLQFIPVTRRQELLRSVNNGLCSGGVLLLSEKVRSECDEIQETCTWIYEDFKHRRKYTKREIARKKEALMNILVPYSEKELRNVLSLAGFVNVEIIAKWNNFTTIIARKEELFVRKSKKDNSKASKTEIQTPYFDELFDDCPVYLSDYLDQANLQKLCLKRIESFTEKGKISANILMDFENIAKLLQSIPAMKSKRFICNKNHLTIGDPEELTLDQKEVFMDCLKRLKPWKKGPLELFGTVIDTEWRSDWKWERLQKSMPDLEGKVVCDLGCGNGYYMFRMLEYNPKLVIGIDPNVKAFLEFKAFKRFSGVDNLHFELLRGDAMTLFPKVFDVVFCLGVLYHTNDPIGMLRDIHNSMKGKAHLIVDCQGIPGDDPVSLFPKKRYANMKGTYFLPTLSALQNWLQRANFINMEVIFSQKLSVDEQRITEWAPVTTSLEESLDANDMTKTMEGYPAPHRFYVRVQKQ